MPGYKSKVNEAELLALLEGPYTLAQMAARLGVSIGSVQSYCKRRGWALPYSKGRQFNRVDHRSDPTRRNTASLGGGSKAITREKGDAASATPPSPAMLRLAQFDPIVARALRQLQRGATGTEVELDDESELDTEG